MALSKDHLKIEIHQLTAIHDLKEVQKLDETVWNEQPIPLHQIITSIQNGGLVLGAYNENTLVGFSYSFAGFKNGGSYLCSHMLGIHPKYQARGIGAQLKEVQKQKASKMGYSLITWTYDPLESRNAFLNLSKLHAVCSTYVENCYGDMVDDLNNGLPSDRFKVEWWINSPHVNEKQNIEVIEQPSHFDIIYNEKGLPKIINVSSSLEAILQKNNSGQILVPIPSNFQVIKKVDFDLAVDWRLKVREIFKTLFHFGFAVCALKQNEKNSVNYYVLMKKEMLSI